VRSQYNQDPQSYYKSYQDQYANNNYPTSNAERVPFNTPTYDGGFSMLSVPTPKRVVDLYGAYGLYGGSRSDDIRNSYPQFNNNFPS
jgi:hypothetical protein